MAATKSPTPLSMRMTENTVLELSTTAENTTTSPATSSSAGEETITITYPGLLMTTNKKALALLSKATNTYTNIYTMPSIGTSEETGLSLEPGGVTQDPSHSEKSSLLSDSLVSDREIDRVM